MNDRTLGGEQITDSPSRDYLIQEQRILSQKKITIQMELIAVRIQLKNLPTGEKNQERKQQATEQIQKYEAQLKWICHEVMENAEQIHAHDRGREEREKIKWELQMLEKAIQSLEKKIMNLRIRMRTCKPLEVYRRASFPFHPMEKTKGGKNRTTL